MAIQLALGCTHISTIDTQSMATKRPWAPYIHRFWFLKNSVWHGSCIVKIESNVVKFSIFASKLPFQKRKLSELSLRHFYSLFPLSLCISMRKRKIGMSCIRCYKIMPTVVHTIPAFYDLFMLSLFGNLSRGPRLYPVVASTFPGKNIQLWTKWFLKCQHSRRKGTKIFGGPGQL